LYIPSAAPWYKFAEWQELYGEIVLIWLLGKPMVILNSVEAARELLERKGANFSGRPPSLYIKEWCVVFPDDSSSRVNSTLHTGLDGEMRSPFCSMMIITFERRSGY
jgi:hypothetical protein